MGKITRYTPAFVDGEKTLTADFLTLEELKEVAWVNRIENMKGFTRFTLSENALMANFEKDYYVVGFIDADGVMAIDNIIPQHSRGD